MNSKAAVLLGSVAALAAMGWAALAQPDNDELVIEGETLVTETEPPEGHPLDRLYSGWRFRSDETQQLETDDFMNPAMVAVDYARDLWDTPMGTSNKSCADCHGDVEESMEGLRANMPRWNQEAGEPWTLEDYIMWSMKEHQGSEPWAWESEEMLAMTSLIALQSRGMPLQVNIDGPMREWWEKGKDLYYTRVGQLDLACANCHEGYTGMMIRADHLSQGQINGFPTYRLKWQGIGSIHRRFTGCMRNIRAEPYKRGSDEFTALELYVAWRGTGLDVESPAVRQ